MTSSYTPDLRFTKQGTGDNDGTWGTVANNVFQLIEDAIAGDASINISATGDYTLSTNNGSTDEARKAILEVVGAPVSAKAVIIPSVSKLYLVKTSISTSVTVQMKTNSGVAITLTNGTQTLVMCDGLDTFKVLPILTDIGAAALSDAQTFTGGQRTNATAVTSNLGLLSVDMDANNDFTHTFTENTTLQNPSAMRVGQKGRIFFTQHASSPKTLGFGSYYKFVDGRIPTASTTNSAVDCLYYDILSSTQIACSYLKGFSS